MSPRLRKKLAALLLLLGSLPITLLAQTPEPHVAVGRVERLANFPSRLIDARHIDVWLPEHYNPQQRYAVLYMHDGQMLYDANTTWNKQAWNIQDTVQRLINQQRIPPTIVVGIWNNGAYRHSEYFPQKYLAGMPAHLREKHIREHLQGKPQADNYLRFLVEELKPAIDARYATRPEAASTFIMGSSMGGMISLYAISEYPQVFGGAAGLSTHWVGSYKANAAIPLAAFNYLRAHLAPPASHKLYQDHGTLELDALYGPYQSVIDDIIREAGYEDQRNYMTLVFDGTGHRETAWAARLETPLLFLLEQR